MNQQALAEYVKKVPKAELHCHLEGSISPETALLLAERNKVAMPFKDLKGAQRFYLNKYRNFDEFANVFLKVCEVLRSPEDYEKITLDMGADAALQGIIYREVFFGFLAHESRGVVLDDLISGIAAGRCKAKEQYGVEMRFIVDISRNVEPADGVRTVELAYAAREKAGIIGIGLDGPDEVGFPAKRQKPAFDRARQLGFRVVAHAGELGGPESVKDAIDSLKVDRVDHGVRSIEDRDLVAELARKQIPLTVCPLCNVALSVYQDLESHPIKQLMDAGVFITVNSDDPAMVHSNLIDNYLRIAVCFSLSIDDIERLMVNGFRASFIPQAEKTAYLSQFYAKSTELRSRLFAQ